MNRNTEQHFSQVPHEQHKRSTFDRSHKHLTTINEGDLVPIYWDEVLPGDTVKIEQNALIRMSTPIFPVMDNCNIDFYWFYVPNRLVWEHWEEFMGENKSSYWAETTEYRVPLLKGYSVAHNYLQCPKYGSILDYMGVPPQELEENETWKSNNYFTVNALPCRAYSLIWNEWFRDQNYMVPETVYKDDTTHGINITDKTYPESLDSATCGGLPLKVSKNHDYFTSVLPEPQKGPEVNLALGGTAKVFTAAGNWTDTKGVLGTENASYLLGATESETAPATSGEGPYANTHFYVPAKSTTDSGQGTIFTPLKVDISEVTAASINDLREAIAIQHLYESFARGGTRYREIIRNSFGVTNPDSRMQIPEYLGGYRLPINISQVIQNSATDTTSPQGNTAAYSLTTMSRPMFTKSFTEHGILMGLAAIRVEHSYQQGLERKWKRTDKFSYYWPELANLGEMAVLNGEIYYQANETDDEVFGYQEAWADYRYHQNRVSGEMRSSYSESLDSWHYADYYENMPQASYDWLKEGTENIDRTLAVSSDLSHQFICDFYFNEKWVRPMPVYSIPGLSTI